MPENVENTVRIAVLDEQMKGIREQQAAHARDTRERFEETSERFDVMESKLDELLAMLNKGKGAYAALFLISGAMGALFIKLAGVAFNWVKP